MRFIFILFIFLLSSVACLGQTKFVAAGLSFGSAVGDDFSGHGGRVGGFAEGQVSGSGLSLGAAGLASLESAPKSGTTAAWEFRARPEGRLFVPLGDSVRLIGGGGVEYVYFNSDQYSKEVLNPLATAGLEIFESHTIRASRLFTDRLNGIGNNLSGWRYGYDLAKKFKGTGWGIRLSGEFNRFSYDQPYGPTKGAYDGNSVVFRLGLARIF